MATKRQQIVELSAKIVSARVLTGIVTRFDIMSAVREAKEKLGLTDYVTPFRAIDRLYDDVAEKATRL